MLDRGSSAGKVRETLNPFS